MSENPYASPNVGLPGKSTGPKPNQMNVASQGARLVNAIIDNIIIRVAAMASGFALGASVAAYEISLYGEITPGTEALLNVLGFILGLAVMLGYYILCEWAFQRTLAKFITGTIVVDAKGGKPSFGQVVGRSFARLIPFEAFSFLSSNPVGWHDSLSGTRVISAR